MAGYLRNWKQHEPRSAQEDLQMQMQLEILLGNVCCGGSCGTGMETF